ncbi:MAG TPA: MlaA family lipoprotein [Rhodopila sp.]|jgi:phospholipid-binding lipoprotein MlaA|nr:MlaA family lipoprotein [Rhodopila sp.]
MRFVRVPRPPITRVHRRLAYLLALGVCLAGCATKPPASDPDAVADYEQTNDPLEPTNRVFYAVNNGLDTVILRPLALGYRYVVPEPVRNGVHNMLSNIGTPVQLANDMMEGKPRRAGDTVMRFIINTTVGVVGFFDVATKWGYPNHDADFGMTLASWGVPEGPFLFLPVLGPSDPRDAVGFGVDIALDPFTWVGNPRDGTLKAINWARFGLNAVDTRERVEDSLQQIKKTALDPYATFRSLYRQHRHSQIEQLRNDNRATVPDWFAQPTNQPAK